MKSYISELTSHPFVSFALVLAATMGLWADYSQDKNIWYFIPIIIVVISIIYATYQNYKLKKIFNNNSVHIPIVINIDSNKSNEHTFNLLIKEIEENTKIYNLEKNLKKYLNISKDDLIFNYGKNDLYNKEIILSFLNIISYRINKIQKNIKNGAIFHIAYSRRPAFGFLLGIVFETDEVIIYQNNISKDKFESVAHIDSRNYKRVIKQFEKFEKKTLKQDSQDKNILIAIKASSHEIAFNSNSLKKFNNIIYLRAKHDGEIKLDEDWVLYAREIFTLINEIQGKYKSITIAHNMPESIAFIVGMAISNYININITQYDEGDYKKVVNLQKIKLFF